MRIAVIDHNFEENYAPHIAYLEKIIFPKLLTYQSIDQICVSGTFADFSNKYGPFAKFDALLFHPGLKRPDSSEIPKFRELERTHPFLKLALVSIGLSYPPNNNEQGIPFFDYENTRDITDYILFGILRDRES